MGLFFSKRGVDPLSPSPISATRGDASHTKVLNRERKVFLVNTTNLDSDGYFSPVFLSQTTRGQFDHPEYSVRRRYQDFLWLRHRLEESYPTHIIPVSTNFKFGVD